MPAKDRYHDTVKRALVKDGWITEDEQFTLTVDERILRVDIQASKEEPRLVILVEVKELAEVDSAIDPPLSLLHYRLLEMLFDANGGVCTRDHVIEAVWPEAIGEGVSEQAIDALVRRLRDQIAEIDPEHQYVVTIRGHGFRLDNA